MVWKPHLSDELKADADGLRLLVVGASSGAALVLEALRTGVEMRKVARHEISSIVDDTHAPPSNYGPSSSSTLAVRAMQ